MPIVKFYRNDPNAPKRTQRTHLGANAIIVYDDKILLEKRRDSNTWGLVGGGVKNHETALQAIVREVKEELGLRIPPEKFEKLRVYGEPGRIAAYCDGSVWQMVIVVFKLELDCVPSISLSDESLGMQFFTRDELKNIEIVVTHEDIVEDCFVNTLF